MLESSLESPLDHKEIQPVHPEGNQSWIFTGRTDAEAKTPILWPPELTHWKRPWCWERLKVGGEGDYRGWDGWMASLTQWTWVWASSRSWSWWWTGKPGVLYSMGLQRVRHDWVTGLNWTELKAYLDMTYLMHAGDQGSVSGSGRSPGEGNSNPLLYSCLESPMDRGPGRLQ